MLSDMRLKVSMVTSRLASFKESFRNFSLLFHHPIRELQSLPHGEALVIIIHPCFHPSTHPSTPPPMLSSAVIVIRFSE